MAKQWEAATQPTGTVPQKPKPGITSTQPKQVEISQKPRTGTIPIASVKPKKFAEAVVNSEFAREFRKWIGAKLSQPLPAIFGWSDRESQEYCIGYVIGLGTDKVVELINDTRYTKSWLLTLVLLYADDQFIDHVFNQATLSNIVLGDTAWDAFLACRPDKFIYVLKKIPREHQDHYLARVVELFEKNRIECVEPLVSAIENEASFDQEWKDAIIKLAFIEGSEPAQDERSAFIMKYFDHPAVDAETYAIAMGNSFFGDQSLKKPLFYRLLMGADKNDLARFKEEVRNLDLPDAEEAELIAEVEVAEAMVSNEGRHEQWRKKRSEAIREALDTLDSQKPFPKDPIEIMDQYAS